MISLLSVLFVTVHPLSVAVFMKRASGQPSLIWLCAFVLLNAFLIDRISLAMGIGHEVTESQEVYRVKEVTIVAIAFAFSTLCAVLIAFVINRIGGVLGMLSTDRKSH